MKLYRQKLNTDRFNTDLQGDKNNINKILDHNLEELDRLAPSEFRGRIVNTENSLIGTVSGGQNDNSVALNDLFTALRTTGKYEGPSGRKIDVNMDIKVFESNLKAEIAELNDLNINKVKLRNNLRIILGR